MDTEASTQLDMLNSRSLEYLKSDDFEQYRNVRYEMAAIALKAQKNSRAFALLAEVCYWDLSGTVGHFKVVPDVVKHIAECQHNLRWTDEQLYNNMVATFVMHSAPVQYFTASEIADIILWERDGDTAALTGIYALALNRFDPKRPTAVTAYG